MDGLEQQGKLKEEQETQGTRGSDRERRKRDPHKADSVPREDPCHGRSSVLFQGAAALCTPQLPLSRLPPSLTRSRLAHRRVSVDVQMLNQIQGRGREEGRGPKHEGGPAIGGPGRAKETPPGNALQSAHTRALTLEHSHSGAHTRV